MNKRIWFLSVLALFFCASAWSDRPVGLVPLPAAYQDIDGACDLGARVLVSYPESLADEGRLLAERLGTAATAVGPKTGNVRLVLDPGLSDRLGDEGYILRADEKGVVIRAAAAAGVFYGTVTMLQLLPASVFSDGLPSGEAIVLPACEVEDRPRFAWRGYMLDVSRRFLDAASVKRLIDEMSLHKMNVFHWHLTDDQGWRMAVPAYPELTATGARLGRDAEARERTWYTADEIRGVVAYAQARHVDVLPEIDVPGHSRSATTAYPKILCIGGDATKSVQGIAGNVWCAGREENFHMLDAIIEEVSDLFPFEFIHIGGDEVNKNPWKHCANCQDLMTEQAFKQVGQVQNFFIRQMETIVRRHGKRMLGWNEIMHGGALESDTAIMAWISTGPGYHAAKKGHQVVMAPGPHTYFDMKESRLDTFGHWWAGIVPMSKVYAFDPMDRDDLSEEAAGRILGVHGCLWTSQFKEGMTVPESADYRTWPRLSVLAEVAWTPQELRDWDGFRARLGEVHLERLAAMGIGYRMPEARTVLSSGRIQIQPELPGTEVHFTTDGSDPTPSSTRWTGQAIDAGLASTIRTRSYGPGGRASHIVDGVVRPPRSDYLIKPQVAVETSMPAYGKHTPSMAVDWKGKTFFWSSRKGRAGDSFTFTFEQPLDLERIEVFSGKLNNPNLDNIVDGDLLVSGDGSAFEKIAGFSFGVAKAKFAKRSIKALQVRLNADHDTWIIVQDPLLGPSGD